MSIFRVNISYLFVNKTTFLKLQTLNMQIPSCDTSPSIANHIQFDYTFDHTVRQDKISTWWKDRSYHN